MQHSYDTNMTNVDDYGMDDMIKICGFKVPHEKRLKRCHRRW